MTDNKVGEDIDSRYIQIEGTHEIGTLHEFYMKAKQ